MQVGRRPSPPFVRTVELLFGGLSLSRLQLGWVLCVMLSGLGFGAPVHAEASIIHNVKPGETLTSISQLYYGDTHHDFVLASENALETGINPAVGMRLLIPSVKYHRVAEGDTWNTIAERYYGEPRRGFVLLEANPGHANKKTPEVGAQLIVPYPLRYTAQGHDPLRQAAREFYDGSSRAMTMLRRFNGIKNANMKIERGEVLLLPLSTLVLSESGFKVAQAQGQQQSQAAAALDKQALDKQKSASEQLPTLREHVQQGRYVEAVALAHQLLGAGQLSGNQLVTIQRELGTALVALDRDDLALDAFKALLEQQPDIELALSDTSPRVLSVLNRARALMGTRVVRTPGKSAVSTSTSNSGAAAPK